MSAPIDCPICMETIEFTRNYVSTECGHCFHANCLMTSVAHNGFGCPYCRTAMAEVPEEEDSDDDYTDDSIDYLEEDTLRGFRFFWNNISGVTHSMDDEMEEDEMEADMIDEADEMANRFIHVGHVVPPPRVIEEDEETEIDEEEPIPPTQPPKEYVVQRSHQLNVSYDDLVNFILGQVFEFKLPDDGMLTYRALTRIIEGYTPSDAPSTPVPVPVSEQIAVKHIAVDHEAQAKPTKVSFIRQVSSC